MEDYLKSELKSSYHPFGKLCKGFAKLLYQLNFGTSETEKQYEVKEETLSMLIKIFCNFIIDGCIFPYEKLIFTYTSLEKEKYKKWIYHIIVNIIWVVNESYLHRVITSLLSTIKVPLKLAQDELSNVKPEHLHID